MVKTAVSVAGDKIPYHIDFYEHYIGREIGHSDWLELDQARVDQFAQATNDMNPLHIDPEWAAREGPFGGSIAHGFLTLSLLSHFSYNAELQPDGVDYGLNIGFDRIRFLAPVMVGDRVRCRFTLLDVKDQKKGRWIFKSRNAVEIESTGKAALSAVWLVLFVKEQGED